MGSSLLIIFIACFGFTWCKYSEWNDWSACTSACSHGVSRRERLLPPLSGEYCHSSIIEEKKCHGTKCSRTTKISQGKRAESSSNLFNLYPAKYAVDGNTNGRLSAKSCTHTKKENNPWLAIDLGKEYTVQRLYLYNRQDCCQDLLNNVYITVGNNSTGRGNQHCAQLSDVGNSTKIEVICASKLDGRYVFVNLRGYRYLVVCEVEVHGQEIKEISRGVTTKMSPYTSSPSYAVDGKPSTIASTKKNTTNPFFTVNFGSERSVSKITINGNNTPYGAVKIYVGNSENNAQNHLCTTMDKTEKFGTRTVYCKEVMDGQYVSMVMAGQHDLHIAEFKVEGY